METMAKLRKCVYPFPVYEAHYADGTYARMSVWQQEGKPWDFERFHRVLRQPMAWDFIGPPAPIVDGYLEHQAQTGQFRMQDPAFSGAEIVSMKRKPPAKRVLRELLAFLDGEHDNAAILDLARQIAA